MADGDDPRAVIEQSIASGWQGLFALKRRVAGPPASRIDGRMAAMVHAELQRSAARRAAASVARFDIDGTSEEVSQ